MTAMSNQWLIGSLVCTAMLSIIANAGPLNMDISGLPDAGSQLFDWICHSEAVNGTIEAMVECEKKLLPKTYALDSECFVEVYKTERVIIN